MTLVCEVGRGRCSLSRLAAFVFTLCSGFEARQAKCRGNGHLANEAARSVHRPAFPAERCCVLSPPCSFSQSFWCHPCLQSRRFALVWTAWNRKNTDRESHRHTVWGDVFLHLRVQLDKQMGVAACPSPPFSLPRTQACLHCLLCGRLEKVKKWSARCLLWPLCDNLRSSLSMKSTRCFRCTVQAKTA